MGRSRRLFNASVTVPISAMMEVSGRYKVRLHPERFDALLLHDATYNN
jgi:hypothetical protein